jgi:hypothetical protein
LVSPLSDPDISWLAEAAVLRRRAYRKALKEAPVRSTAAGGTKPNAVWTLFLAVDANYRN